MQWIHKNLEIRENMKIGFGEVLSDNNQDYAIELVVLELKCSIQYGVGHIETNCSDHPREVNSKKQEGVNLA